MVDLAELAEMAFGEDAGGGASVRQSVGANGADLAGGEGEVHQSLGGLGCVAAAFVLGVDAVGEFDEAVGVGWAGEAGLANGAVAVAEDEGEAVDPGVGGLGR